MARTSPRGPACSGQLVKPLNQIGCGVRFRISGPAARLCNRLAWESGPFGALTSSTGDVLFTKQLLCR
jgi:hypothetical protein